MRSNPLTPGLPVAVIACLLCLSLAATEDDQYQRGGSRELPAASARSDPETMADHVSAWISRYSDGATKDIEPGLPPPKERKTSASDEPQRSKSPNDLRTVPNPRGDTASDRRARSSQPPRGLDNLRKRSAIEASSPADARIEKSEREDEAMTLHELLRHWGIDTSTHGRRGDIEVTEPPRDYAGRGDVPAAELTRRRVERQVYAGRKLLWKGDDVWGYGENDGYQADQAHGDDYEDEEEGQRRYLKGNGHHRKHHHPHGGDNEVRRQQQQQQQQEEEERRRQQQQQKEEERRRQQQQEEEERRRQWEEQERRRRPEAKAEVPRQRAPVPVTNPEEQMSYEERLRQWQRMKEEYDKQVRDRHSGRSNRTKTPEELENERKLQDYIRRNTPINVAPGRRGHHNRTQPPAASQRRPDEPEDRRHQQVPPTRTNEYEEELRLRQQQQQQQRRQQQEEEERRRYQQQQQQQQEEERRRREEEEEEESLRRQQPPPRPGSVGNDEEQRMRENEAIRQAEHQKRLEQEQRRKLIEERSRKYEEQQRKLYEARSRAPGEQEQQEQDPRRRTEGGTKRPYQPVKTESRGHRYEEVTQETVDHRNRGVDSRKGPIDVPRKMWWTERPSTSGENERRDWPRREESTGYPERRRPDQKGWQEEENRRK